ncbi:MAG: hypothetical protein IKX39_04365 [Muribaculaceae bacterium]|nr:hypothetical protein [Muribaculaceae bacterium]
MNKRLLAMLAVVMIAVMTLPAQTHCGNCSGKHEQCEKTILKGDDAVMWAKQHVDELMANYLESAGNKLDPDELRKQFAPIGYDGSDVPSYRAAEKWLVDTVYRYMMKRSINNGNRSITILTGPGGAGKSTSTKNMDFSGEGLLYDSALNSYESLKKVVDKAYDGGMNDIKVIAFYNDIETCFYNSVKRGKVTKRFLGISYLTNAFRSNADKIKLLRNNYPKVKVSAIDNNHNNGGTPVTPDEAEKWDFTVSADQLNHMLVYVLNDVYQNQLNAEQLRSIATDIPNLEGMNDTGKVIAKEIERQMTLNQQ